MKKIPVVNHSEFPGGFVFDPEAWVELAYPSEESVSVIQDGKRRKIKAKFTPSGFEEMVAKFRADKAADPAHSLLVNVDHLALQDDQKTEAAAWLTDLKVESGRLFGRFKWSALGETLARGGVYRFVSVEVTDGRNPPETWADKGAEWNVLNGVAITNVPKLAELRPFSHRADGEESKETKPKGKPKMENIIAALGLNADATPEQVVEAINAMKQKLTEAEAKIAAAAEEKAAAEMRAKEEAFCAKYGGRFATPEAAVAMFRASPDQAETIAETIRIVPAKPDEKPITHRKAGNPDGAAGEVSLAKYRALEGKERRAYLKAHKGELIRLEREEKAARG